MTMRRSDSEENELNVWPAFTDLMSNSFMISMLLLFLLIFQFIITQRVNQQSRKEDPPIIEIEDNGSFRFTSGSAQIPNGMDTYLRSELFKQIEEQVNKNNINIVEIIGHTDGQPNGIIASNLDGNIEKVANNQLPISSLKASSNADLGLMRALAIVQVLKDIQKRSGRLKNVKFNAYSAGQLILPKGVKNSDKNNDSRRRRIEIRFTRETKVEKVKG
jgi:flagellar motor protein MotB